MDDITEPLLTAPWRRFVVIGDSVASGEGEPVDGFAHRGWADSIAAALRAAHPELEYRNLAHRGLLAEEVRETQLDAALRLRPDLALVAAGGNDLFGPGFDGPGVEDELEEMVGALRRGGADVITAGMFDISQAPGIVAEAYRLVVGERLRELSWRTRAVANRHDAIHVDLTYHPVSADPGIYSRDGRHANARGHAIAAAEALALLSARSGAFLVPPVRVPTTV
jgi:lysophospholipase L1-like esterase